MKRGRIFKQLVSMIFRIMIVSIVILLLYLIGNVVDSFAYDYFIFPFTSIIIIFFCGIYVGKVLERMRNTTYQTQILKDNIDAKMKTEFTVKEREQIVTNKKVMKELKDGDKIHVKVFDNDELYKKETEIEIE